MTLEVPEPAPNTSVVDDLPDVNVWLALAVKQHPQHAVARNYWERADAPRLWFSRVTMLALVRLLCQPKVMGDAALDLPRAVGLYSRFADLPEVGLLPEPDACEGNLRRLAGAARPALPARLWTDAYLAAFAISAGLRLVSFDRDFQRFPDLHCLRLPPPTSP